ncbi:sulfur carrier protein ThiS [Streptomyces sp. JH002]|uniref:sulfur carrier protein ThiS n=1 Tax=Streptomyces sp. JH002 TaxID=2763259 RepID=UPI003D806E8E
MSGSPTVSVNGAPRELAPGTTLADLVTELLSRDTGAGVAAAVNECVVPRARWHATTLVPGDRVEILTAVQGG